MINIYLFLSLTFFLTFLLGKLLQKIRIPWIFAALLLGAGLAVYNPFEYITSSPIFNFLSSLGMYFLLFIIGFEINLNETKKLRKTIFQVASLTILLSTIFGGITIHFLFDYSWFVSFLVGVSFSTVGEAILIPILDEFKIINSRLGQIIIGAGTLDDAAEVLSLILVVLLVGSNAHGHFSIALIVASLFGLFLFTFGLKKLKSQSEKFSVLRIETLFLFVIAILFLFLGIGEYAEASALGAILAGIGVRTFLPTARLKVIENEVKAVCYGLFAPIFFLWAGASMDMDYLFSYPVLILLIILVSSGSKYLGSYIVTRKKLGLKQSILLGTGLSVRFSTSIVVIKILFDNNIIRNDLYSTIIASSIIFTFIIPILFSVLLNKWGISDSEVNKEK